MNNLKRKIIILLVLPVFCYLFICFSAQAQINDTADMQTQQAEKRLETQNIKQELEDIKSNMQEAFTGLNKAQTFISDRQVKEFHLQVKEAACELVPGCFINALTYNGQLPGPSIRVKEGDPVRIILHNEGKEATSLYFHGLDLPYKVNGLPRKSSGIVGPGQNYVYQFLASLPGTYWYHPQVPQLDQLYKGLFGALIIESKSVPKTYDRDFVLVISQWQGSELASPERILPDNKNSKKTPVKTTIPPINKTLTGTVFLVNGKSAPDIPIIHIKSGERIRLRLINAARQSCPLSLTGHHLEIISQNGSDAGEPHILRDTITLNPGERMDVEFTANNPGVWSFSSLLPEQTHLDSKFPGGIAVVVRYLDFELPKASTNQK